MQNTGEVSRVQLAFFTHIFPLRTRKLQNPTIVRFPSGRAYEDWELTKQALDHIRWSQVSSAPSAQPKGVERTAGAHIDPTVGDCWRCVAQVIEIRHRDGF